MQISLQLAAYGLWLVACFRENPAPPPSNLSLVKSGFDSGGFHLRAFAGQYFQRIGFPAGQSQCRPADPSAVFPSVAAVHSFLLHADGSHGGHFARDGTYFGR